MKISNNTWYLEWFGKDYLDLYQHRSDSQAKQEVEFILAQVPLASGDLVLDIACGRGRHLKALSEHQLQLIGLDRSQEALAEAHSYIENSANILLVEADMRKLPVKTSAARLLLSMFTSFGYFSSDEEHLAVLKEWARTLDKEGVIFMDYLNRDWVLNNLSPESKTERDGLIITQKRTVSPDLKRIEKRIIIEDAAEPTPKFYMESVRMFTLTEMVKFFRHAGLKVEKIYGNCQGEAFSKKAERLILIASKETN